MPDGVAGGDKVMEETSGDSAGKRPRGRPKGSRNTKPAAQNSWNTASPAERDAAYEEARGVLQVRCKTPAKRAALFPVLTNDVIEAVLGGDPVTKTTKDRVIWAMNAGVSDRVYQGMATYIQQASDVRETITADYEGQYSYFRYHGPNATKFGEGFVQIYRDRNGDPSFNHWSANYPRYETPPDGSCGAQRRPEHRGYVFIGGNRLYLLGRRRLVIRLATLVIPEDRATEPYVGMLLSVRDEGSVRMPFAARTILVPHANVAVLERLRSKDGEGEAAFKSFFADRYWYMG